MRVDLQAEPAAYVKQIADLRRFINRMQAEGGQKAATARMMTATLLPFLAHLRAELRAAEGVDPQEMLTAFSDVMANMTASLIQSMFDAPLEAKEEALNRIVGAAHGTASMMFENDARIERDADHAAKPKLAIINGGKDGE
jgi:hypothetical protein